MYYQNKLQIFYLDSNSLRERGKEIFMQAFRKTNPVPTSKSMKLLLDLH